MMKNCLLTILATLLIASSSTAQQGPIAGRIRLELDLTNVGANALASAKARFESRERGNMTRLKFDVEGEDLSADYTDVDVFLNGKFIAAAAVILGGFDVDLDSTKGGMVPPIVNGDVVDVIDVTSSTLLFTGTFGEQGGNNDPGGGQDAELEVQMTNFGANPLASAHARHETRPDRTKFNVEGEDLTGEFTVVDIYAAGKFVDSAMVDAFGRFTLDIDTSEGDGHVPSLREGDLVEVVNANDGTLMFAGILAIAD